MKLGERKHPWPAKRPVDDLANDYPTLVALAQGCVSGRISEWPRLKPEVAKALDELKRLRALTTETTQEVNHEH